MKTEKHESETGNLKKISIFFKGNNLLGLKHYKKVKKQFFTMVEMLVVMSIILILAGILLPALNHVWRTSKRSSCSNNLRQMGIALESYFQDYRFYPATFFCAHNMIWRADLGPVAHGQLESEYLMKRSIYYCPSASAITEKSDYAVNWGDVESGASAGAWGSYLYRNGAALESVAVNANSSKLAIMMDYNRPEPQKNFNHKQDVVNILCLDGHVKAFPNGSRKLSIPESEAIDWVTANYNLFLRADESLL